MGATRPHPVRPGRSSPCSRPTIQPFALDEVRVLLTACVDNPIGQLVTGGVLTVMRLGELLGLQWGASPGNVGNSRSRGRSSASRDTA